MFSVATITSGPFARDDAGATLVDWTSSGTDECFQLYANRMLIWAGFARHAIVPTPIEETAYQVGTVDPSEENTDFSADLPALQGAGNRVLLSWLGGTWEEPANGSGMAGFHVYGEATPGAGINYTASAAIGDVAFGVPGVEPSGYGVGPYGIGGYDSASGTYYWTSGPLTAGTWHHGVKAYDNAGNESTAVEYATTLNGPPQPPARDTTTGLRLALAYDPVTFKATLSWLAAP